MEQSVQGMTPSDWIALAAILLGAVVTLFTMIWQTCAESRRRNEDRAHERQRINEQHAHQRQVLMRAERVAIYTQVLDLATRQYTAFYTQRSSRASIETTNELLNKWTALEAEVSLVGSNAVLSAMREFEAALMAVVENNFDAKYTTQASELEGRMALAMRADLQH